jgi:P-type E1-E2 ATPase
MSISTPVDMRFLFDTRRRRMSVVSRGELVVTGAPESLLPRCCGAEPAAGAIREMAGRGLRVIAVAARPSLGVSADADPDRIEADLELFGLLGLEDPPRPEASASIASCRRAGIRVAMITGDHP